MEGTRPLLVEVQALVAPTEIVPPRRIATGIDRNRLAMVLAVLARHGGPSLASPTCSSTSPAASASTSPAPTSRSRWRSPPRTAASRSPAATGRPLACFGEVGLTGELRHVAHPERRVAEALKFGLGPVVGPAAAERIEGLRPGHASATRCAAGQVAAPTRGRSRGRVADAPLAPT